MDYTMKTHHLQTAVIFLILHSVTVSPLQFIQEPSNHVAVELSPTWWHCIARGNPDPSYTWIFNGQPITASQTNYNVISNGTLYIHSVDANSIGSYQCRVVAGTEIVTSSTVELKLATLSRTFSINPSSQSSNLEDSVIFECAITSLPKADITWQLNGIDVEDGRMVTMTMGEDVTRSTLTLVSLRHEHSGQYRCIANNPLLGASSVVYSSPATLTLIGRPGFSTTPSPMTAVIGGSISFHCETTGSPIARIEWLDANNQIISTSNRFTSTQNSLTISGVRQSDAGYYTCKAVNEWGDNTASALLTVTDPSQQVLLTRTPTDQSVAVGSRATFSCEASGTPKPRITWNKIDGRLPSNRLEEPAVGWLRITNVQTSDNGIYRCTASNQLHSISAQAQLIVLEGPLLSVTPDDTVVREGREVVLLCQANGSPSPTITWTTPVPGLGPVEAPGGPFSSILVSSDGTLTISNVADYHAGTYTCTASNAVGSSAADAYLDVQRLPTFTSTPSDKRVVEGGSIMFRCRAEGNPSAQMTWHFGEMELQSNAKHSVYGNGDLMISNVEKQQEGTYTCTAHNDLGVVNNDVYLRVLIPPKFESFPQDQIIELGDIVKLDCIVSGDPEPAIEWIKDGEQIVLEDNIEFSDTSISINGMTIANLGAYTCIATNEAGTNQMTAVLLTPDVPAFSTPPVNITANLTHPVIIPCRAKARETPSIRWYTSTSNGYVLQEIGVGTLPQGTQGATTFVSVEGDLEFTAVRIQDGGWYTCVAENSIGRVAGTVFLYVNVPPEVSSTNSPLIGKEGDSYLLLECIVTGNPKPRITWLLPSGQIIMDEPDKYNAQPGTGYLVVYTPTVEEHDGDFTCVANNLLGLVEVAITVTIRGSPVLHNILITRTDSSVTIHCLTKGSPLPTITWARDTAQIFPNSLVGHSVNNEGALVITDLQALENHAYYCLASNIEGDISATIKLPEAPSMPRIISISANSVDLSWTPPQVDSDLNVTSYRLQYLRFGEPAYTDIDEIITAPIYRVTGLIPYTGYMFRVQALNDLGGGDYGMPTQVILTAESAPSEPMDIIVESFKTELDVSWSQPAALNGNPDNIAYEISYTVASSTEDKPTLLYKRHNEPPLSVELFNLMVDTAYHIRIRAVNTALNEWSLYAAVNASTRYQAPSTPVAGFSITTNSSDSIFATWQAVQDSSFQAYHLSYSTSDQYRNASSMIMNITDMTRESALITGLRGGVDYVVWMTYSNKGGFAPNSTILRLPTRTEPVIKPEAQASDLPLPIGVIIAIAIGGLVVLLLLIIIILVIRQRQSGSTGGRWHTQLNPDALWIHKRNSFSDDMSLNSYGDSSSGSGQRTGTYDVAMVNQSYQAHDDTAMSTASDYDLGGDFDDSKKKKKKGLRDVIFKSREDPEVVLVSKAVIGDHSPPPVMLPQSTSNEDPEVVLVSKAVIGDHSPPPVMLPQSTSNEAPQRSLAEMLVPFPDEAAAEDHEPSQAEISVISSVSTDFPVFPNADDTLKLANELHVDSKQMRKMARKAEREHKKKMRHDASGLKKKKPSISDRLGKRFSGKSKKKTFVPQTSYAQGDFMLTSNRQRENAAMF